MRKNLTEIVFVLDESGSMYDLVSDTLGGFNSCLKEQKELEGEAFVTTVLFSTKSRIVHDRLPIDAVREMTGADYKPQGGTALLDAVGGAIKHIEHIHRYAREEDVPEKTVFIITTDGMENSSYKFSYGEIKKMIEEKTEGANWHFEFLAANIDAEREGGNIGINKENTMNFMANSEGVSACYKKASKVVKRIRLDDLSKYR